MTENNTTVSTNSTTTTTATTATARTTTAVATAAVSSSSAPQQRQIPIVCPGHSRPIAEVHYNSKNNIENDVTTCVKPFLISACHDKLPMLRHSETGDWVGTFDGHKGAVWSAKLSLNGTKAGTGAADFTAKIWNAVTGDCLHTFVQNKHIVKCVEFGLSDESTVFLTAGHDKIVRLFDLTAYDKLPMEFEAVTSPMRKVVMLTPDVFATGETNGQVKLWDIKSKTVISTLELDTDGIMDMELNRNGTVLTIAAGKTVYFYNTTKALTNLESIAQFEMPINFKEEGGASLHPTKPQFIAGGSDTYVRVFNYATGKVNLTHKGHHGPVRCLRYAPDGDSFATGSEDGTIRIWQTNLSTDNDTTRIN